MYKFNGTRYMTGGVQEGIPFYLQMAMWIMIDENVKKGLKMDYLQVFKLLQFDENDIVRQKILHTQEVPHRSKELILGEVDEAIEAKIYVIDDVSHTTMLLAEEY